MGIYLSHSCTSLALSSRVDIPAREITEEKIFKNTNWMNYKCHLYRSQGKVTEISAGSLNYTAWHVSHFSCKCWLKRINKRKKKSNSESFDIELDKPLKSFSYLKRGSVGKWVFEDFRIPAWKVTHMDWTGGGNSAPEMWGKNTRVMVAGIGHI